MASKKKPDPHRQFWRKMRWARRVSQGVFLGLFIWLVGLTVSISGGTHDESAADTVSYPVEAFLDADPLVGAIVLLSTGTVPGAVIFGLIVLASAILLGRAFCSWVCPMGTMNHMAAEIAPRLRGKRRVQANRTRPYQKIKYLVLVAVLCAALLGSAVGGLLDPICLATRGVALTLLPIIQWFLSGSIDAAMNSSSSTLQQLADGVHDAVGGVLLYQGGILVRGGVLVSILFIAVLVVNRFVPRFWCRGLCPLGALLGLAGRFGLLTLFKDQTACVKCQKCQLHCSGAASPQAGDPWQRSECDLCLNCLASCSKKALSLRLASEKTEEQSSPDLRRRAVLASAVTGAALIPTLRTGSLNAEGGRPDPACIRPPGAVDETTFLERCIRCGQCMKICPNNALHPALDEATLEGLWSPILVPKIGYCEPTCTLCTQVCPTGAIRRVIEDQKLGRGDHELIKLGTAFIDRGRCLPWAMGTPCIVCEEFCPLSPKAIWFKEEEIQVEDRRITVKRPFVDPGKCNGCGACEHVCPVHDKAAIRVSCAGESRTAGHELLLSKDPPLPSDE